MATRGASSQKRGTRSVLRGAPKRLTPHRSAKAESQPAPKQSGAGHRPTTSAARPPQLEPDIPLDVLNRTYTPKQTSVKASFRTDGDDRQRDQEFADGYADESWGDEDHFTNKSGDPRIGTHHRKDEPKE